MPPTPFLPSAVNRRFRRTTSPDPELAEVVLKDLGRSGETKGSVIYNMIPIAKPADD
jgi:hypothetical protein